MVMRRYRMGLKAIALFKIYTMNLLVVRWNWLGMQINKVILLEIIVFKDLELEYYRY